MYMAQRCRAQAIEASAHKNDDGSKMREAIQYGIKALEAAGFIVADASMNNVRKKRFTLPLSKTRLGWYTLRDDAVRVMAHIGTNFYCDRQDWCAERWFRAAWWGQSCFYFILALVLIFVLLYQPTTPTTAADKSFSTFGWAKSGPKCQRRRIWNTSGCR